MYFSTCGFIGLEQDHVDEGDEDRGGAALGSGVILLVGRVGGPLVEHEQGHVAEHAHQEHDLGNELCGEKPNRKEE